jgi:hypothetical protein
MRDPTGRVAPTNTQREPEKFQRGIAVITTSAGTKEIFQRV